MKVFILNWKLLNNIACLKKQTFFSDFTRPLPIGGCETSIGRRLGCGMDMYAALRGSVVILRCLPQFRVCWTPPQLESQFGYELTETSYLDLEMNRSGTHGSVQKRALNPPHWTTTPRNFLCTAVKCSFLWPLQSSHFPLFSNDLEKLCRRRRSQFSLVLPVANKRKTTKMHRHWNDMGETSLLHNQTWRLTMFMQNAKYATFTVIDTYTPI